MTADRPSDVDLAALAFVKAHGHDDTRAQAVLLNDTDQLALCLALATIASSVIRVLAKDAGRDVGDFIDWMQGNLVGWYSDRLTGDLTTSLSTQQRQRAESSPTPGAHEITGHDMTTNWATDDPGRRLDLVLDAIALVRAFHDHDDDAAFDLITTADSARRGGIAFALASTLASILDADGKTGAYLTEWRRRVLDDFAGQ